MSFPVINPDSNQCGCQEHEGDDMPHLDARVIPHSIRHAAIFGAVESCTPGFGIVLVAPHDPVPLLEQLEQRAPGQFEITYRERGPEAWKLEMVRRRPA